MKVYVTGKVKNYTKDTLKAYIESKGHQFKSFGKTTDLLIVAENPGQGRLNNARLWGVDTMGWADFENKHLKGVTTEEIKREPSEKRVSVTGKITGMATPEIRRTIKKMGHQYIAFSKYTDLLVYGFKPTTKVMLSAKHWGIERMKWEEFVKNVDFQKMKAEDDAKIDAKYVRFNAESGSPFEIKLLKETGMAFLNSMNLTKFDLTGIEKLTNLTRLHLDRNRLSSIDLSPLSQVKNLSWLILSNNILSSIDLSPIANCNLNVLELAHNQLDDIDLSHLASCPELNTLILSSNKIKEIDLDPLNHCPRLQHLYLSDNRLEKIDLSPLSTPYLENLYLNGNKLQSLDLSHMSSIRHLNLSGNRLQDIDISSLTSGDNLTTIDISNNHLKTFDLAPLSKIQSLRDLILIRNQLKNLDLTPVAGLWSDLTIDSYSKIYTKNDRQKIYYGEGGSLKSHILLEIEDDLVLLMDPVYRENIESTEKVGFCDIKHRITWTVGPELAEKIYNEEGWKGLKKRLKILPRAVSLSALRMSELDGLEYSIEEIINCVPDDSTFDNGVSIAYSKVVTVLREQLEVGDSTLGLDVDTMQKTEASILIPRILELRKKEIEEIVLVIDEKKQIHLGDIYRTYYGAKLLKELDLGWTTDETGLERLVQAFDHLGLEIEIQSSL